MPGSISHPRISSGGERCLDTAELEKLEQSFRVWAGAPNRSDTRLSRKRILLIFLLIRHTGARLSEVLFLAPSRDIDYKNHLVRLLPVVQKILGHSTPNLAAAYVEFSEDEIRQVARYYVDKESQRKTSARKAFFGKIHRIQKGDLQSIVEITSLAGYPINAVITNHSSGRLGLKRGTLVMAEVKAPWVMLYKSDKEPRSTAENLFRGIVHRITGGTVTTEVVVRIAGGTELCSVITEKSWKRLDLKENDPLWVAFNAFAVVLHVD